MTQPELCLSNFLEHTAEATDWYLLGAFMKLPPKDLSLIEKQFSSGGPTRCKAELFNVWMKRTPNASWELIAAALEKSGETVLAENVRKLAHVSHTNVPSSSTVRVVIEKSLVVSFSRLEREFAVVVKNLKMSLERKQLLLKELERFVDIRLDLDMELSQISSIDDLFKLIKPHFCLFNTVILKDLVEEFVGEPLKQQLEEYENELENFFETAELSLLEKVEFLDQYSSADMPQVIFKLTGFWPSVTIKRFQKYVDQVFEANSSALTHIRVKQGCICVTWYARKSAIASLAARAQEKVLFMRHVGVLSLSVGDTVILEQEETEEEETDLSSALIQASTADCTEAVEFLLFLGADPNYTSANGTTPLILACRNNSISIAKLLLRAEANVNAQDKLEATALKEVCSLEIPNKDLVELLTKSGARLVIPGEETTIFEISVIKGHTDIVQYLVNEGAPVNSQDKSGVTALELACCHRHAEIVQILLDREADPNLQDQDHNTALIFACYRQMTAGVKLLLAHGANHSLRGPEDSTSLMYACYKGSDSVMDPGILTTLLSAGAVPNAQNEKGTTALMVAAQYGYKEGVAVLLNAQVDVNIQNKFGITALHVAAQHGFLSITDLLLASGAQATLTDDDGMTPLDYARDNNHHDVCQLLFTKMASDLPLSVLMNITGSSRRVHRNRSSSTLRARSFTLQHSSVHRLDQLRFAVRNPLSPADAMKHHQADEENRETSKLN